MPEAMAAAIQVLGRITGAAGTQPAMAGIIKVGSVRRIGAVTTAMSTRAIGTGYTSSHLFDWEIL